MAQSPMIYFSSVPSPFSRIITKLEDTLLLPGLVFTSCSAGRTVSAVE